MPAPPRETGSRSSAIPGLGGQADGIGGLGVVEGGRLAGVVPERDVVHHPAQGTNPEDVTAAEEMAHGPVLRADEVAGSVSMRDLFEVLVDVAAHEEEDVVVVPSGTRVVVRQE